MSAKPIWWHEECLRNASEFNDRNRQAAEYSAKVCSKNEQQLRDYAAQIARAKKEGRTAFDREKFGLQKISAPSADIHITHGSAMADGSCNSCGRTTQTHGDYSIHEVRLRSLAFRVCEDCARILASLLRGEVPNEQPESRGTR